MDVLEERGRRRAFQHDQRGHAVLDHPTTEVVHCPRRLVDLGGAPVAEGGEQVPDLATEGSPKALRHTARRPPTTKARYGFGSTTSRSNQCTAVAATATSKAAVGKATDSAVPTLTSAVGQRRPRRSDRVAPSSTAVTEAPASSIGPVVDVGVGLEMQWA